jgi:CheY-like chemotaxis protein
MDEQPSALVIGFCLGSGMDGRKLAEIARRRYPDVIVVMMSGDVEALRSELGSDETLLAKPFTGKALLEALSGAAAL